jgi:hypothetical protein
LLDDANGVNVVEENLAGPLTAVDEDFIIYDAAAVGVSGFGHVANLLALVPSQGLSCKVLNLLWSSISEFGQPATDFITPDRRLIPVKFGAKADQHPGIIEAVLILIETSVNNHQIAYCLANMGLTGLRCILRTS